MMFSHVWGGDKRIAAAALLLAVASLLPVEGRAAPTGEVLAPARPDSAGGLPPASGDTLGLAAALNLAATDSRAAAIATTDLEAAEAAIRRARAGWWPTLDLSASYTVLDNPVLAKADGFQFQTSEQKAGQYDLTARELLFDGGRRHLGIVAAEHQAAAVRSSGLASVQQAQLGAMDAYLGVLEATGRAHVLQQRLDALSAHRKVVDDLYQEGLTTRNDILETEVRVRQVQDQIQAVGNQHRIAEQDLNRRLGRDPAAATLLPDSLPPPPPLPAGRPAFVASAERANAGLLAAGARLSAGEAEAALARRLWVPSLFVGASHSYQQNRFLVHEFVNSVTAGLSWNVFDGGARGAAVRQAQAGVVAARRDRLETERAVAVAVDAAWRAWDQARREEKTAVANVAATQENLRIVEDQYRNGLARSSDVLDAEALLAASRFEVVTRHYATYRAQADLLVAAGHDLVEFYGGAAGAGRGR